MDRQSYDKKKNVVKKKTLSGNDEIEIYQIEQEISDEITDREFKKLEEVVGELDNNTHTNIWKEMKKAFPSKQKPLPTGVKISLLRRLQAQTLHNATPPICKINPFRKMTVTFEPLMRF